ncbi:uncharacterized protein K452DRAFT_4587 [Aplosporella prunicola CBS 121167]|uniref:Uncharacterized protein n=1 Tax=Aplosporella prunicola CBS 121167 TaxID=1176127 RepID=A0A6A6BTY6_9PEZI|nr:uncharacterized protein K452DRAFT_4587 [Aplosporella prunicola CBS 121167]KAF2147278.1 hypothetical protein K452DRAFT_4587 [Aplosporella prunicola CBS 121167]
MGTWRRLWELWSDLCKVAFSGLLFWERWRTFDDLRRDCRVCLPLVFAIAFYCFFRYSFIRWDTWFFAVGSCLGILDLLRFFVLLTLSSFSWGRAFFYSSVSIAEIPFELILSLQPWISAEPLFFFFLFFREGGGNERWGWGWGWGWMDGMLCHGMGGWGGGKV